MPLVENAGTLGKAQGHENVKQTAPSTPRNWLMFLLSKMYLEHIYWCL